VIAAPFRSAFLFALVLAAPCLLRAQTSGALGIFEGHTDVGTVSHPGSATFDAATQAYTITGSGDDMWAAEDDFQFAWKKMSGDVALSADIRFAGTGGHPRRKAVLMVRQSLDTNAKAAFVAWHGNGMTALQYRDEKDGDVRLIQFAQSAPTPVRIERRGDYIYTFVSDATGKLIPAGASAKLAFSGPVYVGLGVCSHDKNVTETAIFSNVKLEQLPPAQSKPVVYSTLETVAVNTTYRQVAYVSPTRFETPNFSGDGKSLLFDQGGLMRKFVLNGNAEPTVIPTGSRTKLLGDHGVSPDGKMIQISDSSADGTSRIYVVPIEGGEPRLVTKNGPSYTHGWSPDLKTLAFEGMRNGALQVYTIPVGGGDETQLTLGKAYNDCAEFAGDGRSIYFASDRTGSMQIWQMQTDGSTQQQVLTDDREDWFPHVSPDGTMIAFLAYIKGTPGHPADTDVELRLMTIVDKKVKVLAKLLGGRGTINGPSWSPDSRKVAFVSYSMIPEEDLSPQ
jgi:WD40 repeat protein